MSNKNNMKGLVLVGGKSRRMGQDKALLTLQGATMITHAANLLKSCHLEVFVSCNKSQKDIFQSEYSLIIDQFDNIGPIGGIYSALNHDQNCDWLVMACDMPKIDKPAIELLIQAHQTNQITTFKGDQKVFPETTITIYPKTIIGAIKYAIDHNDYRLQKLLKKHNTYFIKPSHSNLLMNVNDPITYSSLVKTEKK